MLTYFLQLGDLLVEQLIRFDFKLCNDILMCALQVARFGYGRIGHV